MIRTVSLLAAASLLVACQAPTADVTLSTTGGHIVDSRGWAVGSRMGIAASWSERTLGSLALTTPDGSSLLDEDTSWVEQLGMVEMPFGAGYASVSGVVTQATDFDLRVVSPGGDDLVRVPMTSSEVDTVALGVALDDCPEFADIVLPEDAVLLEGTELMVYPAPLDADGRHLLGGLDFTIESDGLQVDAYDWGFGAGDAFSYPTYVTVDGDASLSLGVAGDSYGFQIDTVSPDAIVAVGIDAQAEKHGFEDESLLTVFGETADGRKVFGVEASWSGADASSWNSPVSAWVHAHAGEVVDACIGDLCATWSE